MPLQQNGQHTQPDRVGFAGARGGVQQAAAAPSGNSRPYTSRWKSKACQPRAASHCITGESSPGVM